MKKKQNIIILAVAIVLIGSVIGLFYYIEQVRLKGENFGNELLQIQEELKQAQVDFNSKVTQWKEGELSKEDLLNFSEEHFKKIERLILRYDSLTPPETFSLSVDLFKLSTQAQLDSDKEFVLWIETGDEAHSIRSDSILQESFEYEMDALTKFNAAKKGITP